MTPPTSPTAPVTPSEELLRCPCCEGPALYEITGGAVDAPDFWIECEDCGLRTGLFDSIDDAAAAWNHRPTADADLAKMRALIEKMEFGSYQIIGNKEGRVCQECYRFKREGHNQDCNIGRAIRSLSLREGGT